MTSIKKILGSTPKEVKNIERLIEEKEAEINTLSGQLESLKTRRLELLIKPFKFGDRVYAEVNMGRTRKRTECILEAGEGDFAGTLYLRPIKSDGEPSGRRYSLCPIDGNYQDLLELVE